MQQMSDRDFEKLMAEMRADLNSDGVTTLEPSRAVHPYIFSLQLALNIHCCFAEVKNAVVFEHPTTPKVFAKDRRNIQLAMDNDINRLSSASINPPAANSTANIRPILEPQV